MKNLRRFTILKWVPRVLMLAVVGFSVYVYFNYGKTDQKNRSTEPPAKPSRVLRRTSNISYTHFEEGKPTYHVNADQQTQLKNNAQRLENPEFIFYDKDQKESIRVTGKFCSISKDMSSIVVSNDTQVHSAKGMAVFAKYMEYDGHKKIFTTEAPSRFEWKTMNGKAKGFTYQIQNEVLILPKDPEIHYVNEKSSNKEPVVMQGDKGFVDRKNGFAYMENNVTVIQGPDRIKADRIESNFKPNDNVLQKITAYGAVHAKFARPQKADAQQPASNQPDQPQPAKAAPPDISNVFSTDQDTGKELDAKVVEMYFLDDGKTIHSFHSTGDCVFVLHTFDPSNKPKEDRVIKGDEFDATFDDSGNMEQFHATDNVSVHVQPLGPRKPDPAAQSNEQTIYCKDLVADFIPDTGDIKQIHFNDSFRHLQNKQTVSSDKAVYNGDLKKTDLIGNPEIQDATYNITADNMELFEENNGIHAAGNVKSSFIRGEGNNPKTFPFTSPSNDPVYISSENMEWNSGKSEATYTGKAKLWQEKNVITANKMIINDRDKTLSAYEKVHTIFYNQGEAKNDKGKKSTKETKGQTQTKQSQTQNQTQSQPQGQTQKADMLNPFADTADESESGPITVDAGIMNYVENDRIIHFEKEVRIVTPSTKIDSQKADFHLKQQSSDFDRLYALGDVKILHEQKHGSGNQATFFALEKKLVLEGSPKLTETGKADIFGHVLTLFLTDGRILIDGQEDGRATSTLQMEGSTLITPSKKSSKNSPNAGSEDRKPN